MSIFARGVLHAQGYSGKGSHWFSTLVTEKWTHLWTIFELLYVVLHHCYYCLFIDVRWNHCLGVTASNSFWIIIYIIICIFIDFFHFLRIVIVQIVLTNIWCPQMYCIHYLCLVPAWRSYGHYFWTWCKKGARNASFSHCVLVWSGPETKVFIFFSCNRSILFGGKKCALSANTCPLCFFSPVKKICCEDAGGLS